MLAEILCVEVERVVGRDNMAPVNVNSYTGELENGLLGLCHNL